MVEKFPQKFLRELFIIFVREGCADFSFKEISDLFQTGNCWGSEIRLFRTLMQLDSSGVVPWPAGQFACSVPVLLLWELPPFPRPAGWTLGSWLNSRILLPLMTTHGAPWYTEKQMISCAKPVRVPLEEVGFKIDTFVYLEFVGEGLWSWEVILQEREVREREIKSPEVPERQRQSRFQLLRGPPWSSCPWNPWDSSFLFHITWVVSLSCIQIIPV